MPKDIVDLLILTVADPEGALPDGDPERMVFVEPDPASAVMLRRRVPQATVIDAALAGRDGEAMLTDWNLPGLRSLRAPGPALTGLFPGLRETGRRMVTLVSPGSLFDRLNAGPSGVALHLDSPGEEAAILAALDARDQLGALAAVTLRCGAEPFFDAAEAATALAARLEEAGLREIGRDTADPDFPVLRFERDSRLQDLRARLTTAEAERDRLAPLEAELTEVRVALQHAQQHAETLEAQLADARAATQTAQDRASGLVAQLAERDTAQAEEHEEALEQAREDLALALRMQDMLQGDVEDLRTRYQAAEAARARQASLLAELAPRLRQAAEELGLTPLPEAPAPGATGHGVATDGLADPNNAEPAPADLDPARLTAARRKSGKKARAKRADRGQDKGGRKKERAR